MGGTASKEETTTAGKENAGVYKSDTMSKKSTVPGLRHVNPEDKFSFDPTNIADRPRKLTDCFCILLIVAHWVAMTAIGIQYGTTANVDALFAPSDYRGKICGIDAGVLNKPYGYIINTNLDIVCVSSCFDQTQDIDPTQNAYENMICLDKEVSASYKTATSSDPKYNAYTALFNDGEGLCNFELGTYTIGSYCLFDPHATIPNTTQATDRKSVV